MYAHNHPRAALVSWFTHISTHMPTHMFTHMSTHMSAHMSIYMSIYMSTHVSTHMSTHFYTHVYIHVYIHVHKRVHTHVYTHIYTHVYIHVTHMSTHISTHMSYTHVCTHVPRSSLRSDSGGRETLSAPCTTPTAPVVSRACGRGAALLQTRRRTARRPSTPFFFTLYSFRDRFGGSGPPGRHTVYWATADRP